MSEMSARAALCVFKFCYSYKLLFSIHKFYPQYNNNENI